MVVGGCATLCIDWEMLGCRQALEQEIWHMGTPDPRSKEPGWHPAGPTAGSSMARGEGTRLPETYCSGQH